jgi:hypothetical protein
MESTSYKVIGDFLPIRERNQIINWVNSLDQNVTPNNRHLKHLISKINGDSYMFDISATQETREITQYQSGGNVRLDSPPQLIHKIIDRICDSIEIPKSNCFLQAVEMDEGGTIGPHYDAALDGYINYKCNISISSEDYDFAIGDEVIRVKEGDLYCFEASLYKHWTPQPFANRRILLSFGFMLKYEELGRNENDYRVRLGKRINKYFQNN